LNGKDDGALKSRVKKRGWFSANIEKDRFLAASGRLPAAPIFGFSAFCRICQQGR